MLKFLSILSFVFIFFIKNGYCEFKEDTIYIKCNKEQLANQYYHISKVKDQLSIHFFFSVKWFIHGIEKKDILFVFKSNTLDKTDNIVIQKFMDTTEISRQKNILTLATFTDKLKDIDFLKSIINGKNIILLLGSTCSSRLEMYPVFVGTDLYNEG